MEEEKDIDKDVEKSDIKKENEDPPEPPVDTRSEVKQIKKN